jgi:hypothetical protein
MRSRTKLGSSERSIKRTRGRAICPRGTDRRRFTPTGEVRPNVGKWGTLNSLPKAVDRHRQVRGTTRPFPMTVSRRACTGDRPLSINANERPQSGCSSALPSVGVLQPRIEGWTYFRNSEESLTKTGGPRCGPLLELPVGRRGCAACLQEKGP